MRRPDLVVRLPYTAPPLSMNDRGASRGAAHAKAKAVRDIRDTTRDALVALIGERTAPVCDHAVVELHYRPADRRRRDTDNLAATLKPAADGLVDAQLVPDDDYQHMTRPEPVIHTPLGRAGAALWLEITLTDTTREYAA